MTNSLLIIFCWLSKNQVDINGFRCTVADVVHFLHSFRWILCLKLFGNTFPFGLFFYQLKKEGLRFFLYIGQMRTKLAGSEQVAAENFMVLL